MKREGYVLERVGTVQNVMLAYFKARRGCGGTEEASAFGERLSERANELSCLLSAGDWCPSAYRRFRVWDPKPRVIHAASFADRVVHHALINIAGPVIERSAIEQSYACRKGRGNCAAVDAVWWHAARNGWYLKLDIRRYFDSVGHEVLRELLERRFRDQVFLRLLFRVICSFEKTAGRGLPIGTLTSQYFANFYLDAFDHWVQQECGCGGYARYMDDFVIFHRERGFLEDLLPRIAHWLQQRRGLLLRELPQPVATSEGIPFLGYRVFPGAVLLARRARRRFVARMRVMEGEYVEGLIDRYRLQRRMDALLSFTSHASCRSWRRRVVADCSLLSEDDI